MGDHGDITLEERVARLRALDLFASLADMPLERLARALVDLRYPGGAAIIREGEEGEYFYVIVAGEVGVVRGTRLIAVRGPGEYFGEGALLHGVPWPASVFARTAVTLHALDGQTFVAAAAERLAP